MGGGEGKVWEKESADHNVAKNRGEGISKNNTVGRGYGIEGRGLLSE